MEAPWEDHLQGEGVGRLEHVQGEGRPPREWLGQEVRCVGRGRQELHGAGDQGRPHAEGQLRRQGGLHLARRPDEGHRDGREEPHRDPEGRDAPEQRRGDAPEPDRRPREEAWRAGCRARCGLGRARQQAGGAPDAPGEEAGPAVQRDLQADRRPLAQGQGAARGVHRVEPGAQPHRRGPAPARGEVAHGHADGGAGAERARGHGLSS